MTTTTPVARRVGSNRSLLPAPVTDLLDETAATRILADAGLTITRAQPDYLRHKPGETSIVSYRFDTPDRGAEGLGYAQWCARTERADEIHCKALTLRPRLSAVGVSTIRVDDHTVFYGFPNDARLRRLRWYTTPRKLKPTLAALTPAGEQISKTDSTSTVLTYKPERRLVTRVDLATTQGSRQSLLVRYTTGRDAPRLAAIAAALLGNGVQTPTPRAQLDNGSVGVDDFIAGVELRTWVREHGSVADSLADALLTFHRTPHPESTPVRLEPEDLAKAVNGLLALSLWDRDLSRVARQVADQLSSKRPTRRRTPTLIHGDLHDKNVLVHDGQPWFIDLERAAMGSPASDLGLLRAYAISLDIRQPGWSPTARAHAEQVIDCYQKAAAPGHNDSLDDRTLAWYCAVALVDQALLVTRHVEAGWEANTHALLEAAATELDPPTWRPRRDATKHQGANLS